MEDHGLETAKKPRLDPHAAGIGPQYLHRQHSDPAFPPQERGGAPRLPLAPPNAYRPQAPHSPYQMQEHPVIPEHGAQEGGYSQGQPSAPLPQRDLRSAPPVQTSFPKGGPASRSPDSAPVARPLNTGFEGEPPQYGPHSASEVVDQGSMYPPQEGPPHPHHPHGSYPPHMMVGPPPYEGHHGPPPPGTMNSYGDPEMQQGMPPGQHYQQGYGAPQTGWGRPQPRRNVRAAQACDTCRTRKVKCDEGKPKCSYCRENDQPCVYKEVQPAKQDRAQREIMQALAKQQNDILILQSSVTQLMEMIQSQAAKIEAQEKNEAPEPMAHSVEKPERPSVEASVTVETMLPPTPVDVKREATNEQSAAPSTSLDHSVGVHRLLRWPTIDRLTKDPLILRSLDRAIITEIKEDYVLKLEKQKGVLRLFGVGQGQDLFDGALTFTRGDNTSTPPSMDEPVVPRSPAASPPDVWGTGLAPPNVIDGKYANETLNDHPGGLNRDGSLRMDGDTMALLFESYIKNIQVLHPFLHELRLKRMFERVRSQMNPWETTGSPFLSESTQLPISRKRRRSNDMPYPDPGNSYQYHQQRPEPEHRISSVIVLLVMALGKICNESKPLRGPVPEDLRERSSTHSTITSQGSMSPGFHTSPSQVSTPGMDSPGTTRSQTKIGQSQHQISVLRSFRKLDKNIDVIPGLAYFAYAVKILGSLQGGSDLPHVQANLLASLYCGQHASTLQSWSYLSTACRICLELMKGHPFDNETKTDPVRVELIYFAYWTCYQLESDILAELDLQPSGIDEPQQNASGSGIRYPSIKAEDGSTALTTSDIDSMIKYYHFQLHLRNTMNKIQPLLYPPDAYLAPRKLEKMLDDRYNCRLSMQEWRDRLVPEMVWSDLDPPSNKILVARLRAKYYGAMYIINRPLLEYALHKMRKQITPEIKEAVQRYRASPPPRSANEVRLIQDEMEVYYACVDCIEAARQSTLAFDGLVFEGKAAANRLIVTNIFGTAHAQFGNMLVLAAAYKSQLNFMVDPVEFIRLLERTIELLDKLSPISNTLATDRNIIQAIRQNIHSPPMDHESVASSFSSGS